MGSAADALLPLILCEQSTYQVVWNVFFLLALGLRLCFRYWTRLINGFISQAESFMTELCNMLVTSSGNLKIFQALLKEILNYFLCMHNLYQFREFPQVKFGRVLSSLDTCRALVVQLEMLHNRGYGLVIPCFIWLCSILEFTKTSQRNSCHDKKKFQSIYAWDEYFLQALASELIERQRSPTFRSRLTNAFHALTTSNNLSTTLDRLNHQKFRKNLHSFLVEVRGFLRTVWDLQAATTYLC